MAKTKLPLLFLFPSLFVWYHRGIAEKERRKIKREQFVLSGVARAWNFIYRFPFEVVGPLVDIIIISFFFIYLFIFCFVFFALALNSIYAVQVQVEINGRRSSWYIETTVAGRSSVFLILFVLVFACSSLICIRFYKW